MKAIKLQKSYHLSSLLIILVCTLALFSLDRETKHITDLFALPNLFAVMLYVVPTYLICFVIYIFFKSRNNKNDFALSLILGIPAGFIMVILILSISMGRI